MQTNPRLNPLLSICQEANLEPPGLRRENNSYLGNNSCSSSGHMLSYCQNHEEADKPFLEGEIVANKSFRLPRSSKSPAACSPALCPRCEHSLEVLPPPNHSLCTQLCQGVAGNLRVPTQP